MHGKKTHQGLTSAQRSIGGYRLGPSGVHCYQDMIAMNTVDANAVAAGAVTMLLLLLTQE
jgi:hypothetical protein